MTRKYDFDKMEKNEEYFSMGKFIALHGQLFFKVEKGMKNEILLTPKPIASNSVTINEQRLILYDGIEKMENPPDFLEGYSAVLKCTPIKIDVDFSSFEIFADKLINFLSKKIKILSKTGCEKIRDE